MSEMSRDQIGLLKEILEQHKRVFDEAVSTARREQPIVASLEAAIAALENQDQHHTDEAGSGHVSPAIPLRKPEYASMTIIASIQKALAKHGTGVILHADDIIKEIYLPITDNDQFYRIKRTIVSEVIRGVDKRMFRRGPHPNTFGLAHNSIGAAA